MHALPYTQTCNFGFRKWLQKKTAETKAERTDQAMPDDVEDETVEKAADGGEKTQWERLLLLIHLNLIQDSDK